jgi:hypothetical protein
LRRGAERLRAAGVGALLLVHGTFVGTDAAGLLHELARYFPAARDWMGELARQLIDRVAGDNGNYVEPYAAALSEALNAGGSKIRVERFTWSGQNHHLGRAVAAVQLLDLLLRFDVSADRRILCWGHSHAGNVFALATNLLGGDRATIDAFFAAARRFSVALNDDERTVWRRVEQALRDGTTRPLVERLDLVTFGTPIRYGWDLGGYGKLLHFVNHRPAAGRADDRTSLPTSAGELQTAAAGDYVQHLGIAGTNLPPSIFLWRQWWADRRLGRLLQPKYSPLDLLDRLRLGLRVPDAGQTLLVDYGSPEGNAAEHLAGHAVYTKLKWLPFHTVESARWLYEPPAD